MQIQHIDHLSNHKAKSRITMKQKASFNTLPVRDRVRKKRKGKERKQVLSLSIYIYIYIRHRAAGTLGRVWGIVLLPDDLTACQPVLRGSHPVTHFDRGSLRSCFSHLFFARRLVSKVSKIESPNHLKSKVSVKIQLKKAFTTKT